MDIKTIIQDEKKKKIIIIGVIVFLVLLGLLFIFSRKSAPQTDTSGQTQLLTDIAQLAPRDSASQSESRMVAPIITLSADTPTVAPGQPAIITWASSNAISCTDGDGNKVNTVGSLSITPRENYTLDIVCTNAKGTTLESVTVAVTTSPIITLSADPESVRLGEQSFISWDTVNTTRCVDGAGKTLRLSDGFSVAPRKAYTFEINCTGPKGTGKKSVTITIASARSTSGTTKPATTTSGTTPPVTNTNTTTTSGTTPRVTNTTAPTVTVSTNKTTLSPGQTATISWNSTGATSCTGRTPTGVEVVKQDGTTVIVRPADGSVPVPTVGNMQIRVLAGKATATIIISCVGPGGTTEKTITVYAAASATASGPPTITLSANPATVNSAGEQSYISWNTTDATNCTGGVEKNTWAEWYEPVNNVWQNIHDLQTGLGVSGSARVYPGGKDPSPLFAPQTQKSGDGSGFGFGFFNMTPQSTTFTVTCTGPLGSATKSVTVTIVPPAGSCGTGVLGLGCGFW